MATYKIERALPSDAAALAAADVNAEPDPFRQFMEGTADAAKREAGMLKWWTKCIESSEYLVDVVRDEKSGEVVSYAQWELPKDKEPALVVPQKTEEEKAQLREKRAAHIQPGQNGPLLLEWWSNLDVLQTSFGSEPLYYLNGLRTLPAHRGQGLATKLIRRVLDQADEQGLRVGLYTDGDGKAKPMYERLGFAEAGRFEIALNNYGGEGRHLEIAMIRNTTSKE